jgi:isopentenyldiphosphate isomerase
MIDYKKVSAVFLFNTKKELALQLRAADDDSFPSHWDISAGGGIDEGEDNKESAERELQEELGVVGDVSFVCNTHYSYSAWKPGITREADMHIYKIVYDGAFDVDPAEVEKADFFSLEAIQKMIDSEEKFHPEFLEAWKSGLVSKMLDS